MRSIIDFTYKEAEAFFLKGESYSNIDLPKYFDFNNYIEQLYAFIGNKTVSDCCRPISKVCPKPDKPLDYEKVNYQLLTNKDGKYSWRPLQLIHPVLYCLLVKKITAPINWSVLVTHFKNCAKNDKIECISLTVESTGKESDKAASIKKWWTDMEQQSIRLSLQYDYVLVTDITDCYGSMYTHSISWALHTKAVAKKNKKNDLLGNGIDCLIREMSYGQTNGIPQGSVLMDFIAEIILGYIDIELSAKIMHITDYKILRYRDDYRIFCNNTKDLEFIAKALSESLADIGLKLNSSKTFMSSEVIKSSIKPDKHYHITNTPIYCKSQVSLFSTVQKELLYIHDLASRFPNSGTISTLLNNLYEKVILPIEVIKEDEGVLLSIIIDIAFRNPRAYSASFAIASKLLSQITDPADKHDIAKQILKKFSNVPNTGHMQIWLQRLCYPLKMSLPLQYDEPLCQIVGGQRLDIWESCWLSPKFKNKMAQLTFIDTDKLANIPIIFDSSEINIFEY